MIGVHDYYLGVYNHFVMKLEREAINALKSYKQKHLLQESAYTDVMKVLDDVYKKYDFDMHNQLQPAYEHLALYQRQFIGQRDEQALKIAVEFVLFCCLADKFLDSPRFSAVEKKSICKKLDVLYFIREEEYKSDSFCEMDVFLNNIRIYLLQHKNTKNYSIITNSVRKAFLSEIYMSKNALKPEGQIIKKDDLHLLVDKSVEFEKAAFLLTVSDFQGPKYINLAQTIADVIWLIDDLADFAEDVQCKRINSLLYYFTESEKYMTLSDRVELVYGNLNQIYIIFEEKLNLLKSISDSDLYYNILINVWDWCSNVRKDIEKYP